MRPKTKPRSITLSRSKKKNARLAFSDCACFGSLPWKFMTLVTTKWTSVDKSSVNWCGKRPRRDEFNDWVMCKCSIMLFTINSNKNHELFIESSDAFPLETTQCKAISSCNRRICRGPLRSASCASTPFSCTGNSCAVKSKSLLRVGNLKSPTGCGILHWNWM